MSHVFKIIIQNKYQNKMKFFRVVKTVLQGMSIRFNPKRRRYQKLIHKICVGKSEEKLIDIFFTVPLEEREKMFLESF